MTIGFVLHASPDGSPRSDIYSLRTDASFVRLE